MIPVIGSSLEVQQLHNRIDELTNQVNHLLHKEHVRARQYGHMEIAFNGLREYFYKVEPAIEGWMEALEIFEDKIRVMTADCSETRRKVVQHVRESKGRLDLIEVRLEELDASIEDLADNLSRLHI